MRNADALFYTNPVTVAPRSISRPMQCANKAGGGGLKKAAQRAIKIVEAAWQNFLGGVSIHLGGINPSFPPSWRAEPVRTNSTQFKIRTLSAVRSGVHVCTLHILVWPNLVRCFSMLI